MSLSPSLTSLLASASTACHIWFAVDEDGLWVNAQRPTGPLAKGLGKTIDLARLERALPAVIAAAPKSEKGSDFPTRPIWSEIQRAYRAA